MPSYPTPRRGQVWRVSLDPTVGHEVKKTRPAIVVSDDAYNTYNWLVIVMPVTSRATAQYDQVLVRPPEGGLTNPSVTLPDQIRAIDRARLVEHAGDLSPETMARVDHSLRVVLGL